MRKITKDYITSPYLVLQKKTKNRYIFIDYFTNKTISMNDDDYHFLSNLIHDIEIEQSSESAERIKRLLQRHWLFTRSQFDRQHILHRVEIETTTMCN